MFVGMVNMRRRGTRLIQLQPLSPCCLSCQESQQGAPTPPSCPPWHKRKELKINTEEPTSILLLLTDPRIILPSRRLFHKTPCNVQHFLQAANNSRLQDINPVRVFSAALSPLVCTCPADVRRPQVSAYR